MVFNDDGEIVRFEHPVHPVFRKYLNLEKEMDRIEHTIVSILINKPHKNLVKIYEVTEVYYDMEILSTGTYPPHGSTAAFLEDMKEAKEHLQSMGIMYIDWKYDNIGRDQNGTFKLFDFNLSGIWVDNKWVVKPIEGWNYNQAVEAAITFPIAIDNFAFLNAF
jgi:serine/threonine protein kinase